MTEQNKDQENAALAMIKAVYEDSKAEINGREYAFTKMTHKKRRKVFAFMTRVQGMLANHDFSFMDWPDFDAVEAVINDAVTFNDSLLSKVGDHWDKYPEDYLMFTTTALQVISYPFLQGDHTT